MTTLDKKIKFEPNEKQKECIDNIKGQYLVLAGPGTGKTYTIIERIKNILSFNVEAKKILCLTFTDAAASEMKKRIEDELDKINCEVDIFTYHGFCSSIIEEFQEDFELPSNYKVINDVISKALVKNCIDEINPKYFRTTKNDPYFYINTIKNRINLIKQNRLTKEKFFNNIKENPDWEGEVKKYENLIEEAKKKNRGTKGNEAKLQDAIKKIKQTQELWQFYELYSEKMAQNRYIDFNDMINLVLDKFENNSAFLNEIANRYEYIMVDEYQDTNKSQNEIVIQLSSAISTKNIFVVGDDDQIIYRFQGAKLDTIQNYLQKFPQTKIICLLENMRSTQEILDVARSVISQDPLSIVNSCNFKDKDNNPISKNIIAKNEEVIKKASKVRFYSYADDLQEKTEIVKEIEELINSPNCPINKKTGEKSLSQIAILTRSNGELQEFYELLKLKNIPAELKDGKDIFTIPAVNILYFYIQLLVNPFVYSARFFQLLLAKPFEINSFDYQELFLETTKEKTFIEAYKNMDKTKLKDRKKLDSFIETYEYLSQYKTKENIKNTILEIGSKTGIFDYYLNEDINRSENIAGLKRFIEEALGFSEVFKTSFLEEFNTYLKTLFEDDEKILTQKAPTSMNAIQLTTYHSSKGREFEYVYIPTMINTKWESASNSMKAEIPLDKSEYKSEEELKTTVKISDLTKLLYVAMTRAKHSLRLSYPMMINGKTKKPTKLLNLADEEKLFEKEPAPFVYDEINYWQQAKNLLIKKDFDYVKEFSELIDLKLQNREFSPSAINRYLDCPRQYLYNDILDFTCRDGNPNALSYGSSIHFALEQAIKFTKENKTYPTKDMLFSWFEQKLSKLPMENLAQRQNYTKRGQDALFEYYSQITNITPCALEYQEYKIKAEIDDIKFVGIIDRIDKNQDGTYTIIDYKTGNNKTSQIKPDGDYSNYYNQMALYKYFFELKENKKVSKCQFIYPEDFLSKNNPLEFSEDEISEVVSIFKKAIKNIKEHNFNPSYNQNACKYCLYKDFCNIDE